VRGIGEAETAGHIPDSHFPVLLLGLLRDLSFGFVRFVGLDPQARERSVDVIGQLFSEGHGVFVFLGVVDE
jgi:hypothetical protein